MLLWVQIIPLWLVGVTLFIVVLPTISAIAIRYQLYQHLTDLIDKVSRLLKKQSPGIQPTILEVLESRYKSASELLEQVNTAALIDTIYSQECISVLGIKMRCDHAENFCQKLPNLLLAFGLLGTFIGITSNLYNIGEAIRVSETGVDVEVFIQKLQPHLQGMGVAFFTSLVAILFSSVIASINLRLNTSTAKYYLMSYLEDYLDNIFKPGVEGDTRLDKAVDRMVQEQTYFLTRFHENVGKVLEDTFGRAANQITEENIKTNKLAVEIYRSFSESIGQFRTGADIFSIHARKLNESVSTFQEAANTLRDSKFTEELSSAIHDWQNLQYQFSSSISMFSQATQEMTNIVSTLDETSQALQGFGDKVLDLSQQSVLVAESTNQQLKGFDETLIQVQQYLINVSDRLQQTIDVADRNLHGLGETWRETSSNYSSQVQQLLEKIDLHLQQFSSNQTSLNQLVDSITTLDIKLQDRIDVWTSSASHQMEIHLHQEQQLIEKTAQSLKQLSENHQTLLQITDAIRVLDPSLKNLTTTWENNFAQQLEVQTHQGKMVLDKIQEHLHQFRTNQQTLNQLKDSIIGMEANLKQFIDTWTETSTHHLDIHDRNSHQVLDKMDQYIQQISKSHQVINHRLDSIKSTDS